LRLGCHHVHHPCTFNLQASVKEANASIEGKTACHNCSANAINPQLTSDNICVQAARRVAGLCAFEQFGFQVLVDLLLTLVLDKMAKLRPQFDAETPGTIQGGTFRSSLNSSTIAQFDYLRVHCRKNVGITQQRNELCIMLVREKICLLLQDHPVRLLGD